MTPICLVLRAHAPRPLRRYNYFDVGRRHDYFDAESGRRRLARLDEASLRPAVDMLERLLDEEPRFAFAVALSGSLLALLERNFPARLAAFRRLVSTGRVEPLSATSHRRLPWPLSDGELAREVLGHRERTRQALGRAPRVFGGEEPSQTAELARALAAAGFAGAVLEGSPDFPSGEARHRLYRAGSLPVLVGDDRFSSDLSARFSDRRSQEWPISAAKFDGWISATPGDILCLVLDFEIFGGTHRRETGIFEFFEEWVARALGREGARFWTPSEVFSELPARETVPAAATPPPPINELQQDVLLELARLEPFLETGDPAAAEDLRALAGHDTLAAMAMRGAGSTAPDGADLDSPYEVYMTLRHALSDVERRLSRPRAERAMRAAPSPA